MTYVVYVPSLDELITNTLRVLDTSGEKWLKEKRSHINHGESFCEIDFTIPEKKGLIFRPKGERKTFCICSPLSGVITDTYRVLGYSSRHPQYSNGARNKPLTSASNAIRWQYALRLEVEKPVNNFAGDVYDRLLRELLNNSEAIMDVLKNTGNQSDFNPDWKEFVQSEREFMKNTKLPCFEKTENSV